jgi:energy-converting hydrogenase Eha subunit A
MYLVSYGLAAIAAMTAFSALLGLVGKRLRPSWLRSFLFASGVVAIGLGLFWMWTGFPYGK